MEKRGEVIRNPAREASGNLAKALDILADSRKRKSDLKFEEGRLNYFISEHELAQKRGGEEGARRMRELEMAISAVKETIEKLSKPISSGPDASQG